MFFIRWMMDCSLRFIFEDGGNVERLLEFCSVDILIFVSIFRISRSSRKFYGNFA